MRISTRFFVGLFVNTTPGLLECSYIEMKQTGCHHTLFSQRFSFLRLRSTRQISWQSEKREKSWTRRRKSCRTSWIRPWLISRDSNRKPHHGKIHLCFLFPNQIQYEPKFTITKINCVLLWAHQCKSSGVFSPILSPVFHEILIISFWVFYSLQGAESES